MSKLVIAGGSGFIGNILSDYFKNAYDDIFILSRSENKKTENIQFIKWDGLTLGQWQKVLNKADALINLTGKSVNCRYTEKNKLEILNSRINSVKVLAEAIRQCADPPKIWLQASSATIYRSSFDKAMDERHGEIGDDFSMNVCKQWERVFLNEVCWHTRKVIMRIAIVLGRKGGALPNFLNLCKAGLGGRQASGKQMVSWIHENDFARIVEWLISNGKNNSVYNCASPQPVTNSAFMKSIRNRLDVPIGITLPKWLLEFGSLIISTQTELILKSRWVIPQRLLKEGFQFKFESIYKTIINLID